MAAYPFYPIYTRPMAPTGPSVRDKDRDVDDSLLRPITHETTRSHLASESSGRSTGSKKGSFVEAQEPSEKAGLARQQEPRSVEELEEAKKRKEQREE